MIFKKLWQFISIKYKMEKNTVKIPKKNENLLSSPKFKFILEEKKNEN